MITIERLFKTIVDLAHNLQMATVGEGIENLADAQLLQQMDCKYTVRVITLLNLCRHKIPLSILFKK